MPASCAIGPEQLVDAPRQVQPLLERQLRSWRRWRTARTRASRSAGRSGMALISSSAVSRPPVRFEMVPPVATSRTRGAAGRAGSAAAAAGRRRRELAPGRCRGRGGAVPAVGLRRRAFAAHDSAWRPADSRRDDEERSHGAEVYQIAACSPVSGSQCSVSDQPQTLLMLRLREVLARSIDRRPPPSATEVSTVWSASA